MNLEFWRGRRVFITGHTGFKGSWLALWLHRLGSKVTGYALAPPSDPSLFDQADVGSILESHIGDVRDLSRLTACLHEAQPEVIFHMAAQSLVGPSYEDPIGTYATNVMGTVHLLQAARQCMSLRAIVNVTTDKCYENREWVWGYREGDALGGFDPYSNSKACAELVTSTFRSSFFSPQAHTAHGVALATARAGNVIGGGDASAHRLIPDMLRSFAQGRRAEIRQPQSIRPWQHVLEPLRGYLMLAERLVSDGPGFGEAWNFGPRADDARPVRWIADSLCEAWGDGAGWYASGGSWHHEATTLRLDTAKAEARLGWKPAMPLAEALTAIVGWTKRVHAGESPRALTLEQIAAYEATLKHHAR